MSEPVYLIDEKTPVIDQEKIDYIMLHRKTKVPFAQVKEHKARIALEKLSSTDNNAISGVNWLEANEICRKAGEEDSMKYGLSPFRVTVDAFETIPRFRETFSARPNIEWPGDSPEWNAEFLYLHKDGLISFENPRLKVVDGPEGLHYYGVAELLDKELVNKGHFRELQKRKYSGVGVLPKIEMSPETIMAGLWKGIRLDEYNRAAVYSGTVNNGSLNGNRFFGAAAPPLYSFNMSMRLCTHEEE